MSVEKIIGDWKKGNFKPIYWLEGEEPYYIDKIVEFAEHKILSETESSFNLSVFYGKDASWPDVVNACRRYPMFSEKQVVLIKEAQHMKEIEHLESYIDNPLPSTIFVVAYKEKKVDARTKFAKTIKAKGEIFSTKKMYESELPNWANGMITNHGLSIQQKALLLLVDHVGNDLNRLENEIEKLAINLGNRKNITEDDIENYIGISKEFNVFELQAAFGKKDFAKAIRIINYFEKNPKAGPIQLILPSLYSFFSKVYGIFGVGTTDEKTIAAALGIAPFFMKDYMQASRNYGHSGVEKMLLLLHQYNLRSLGVKDGGTSDAGLMKEFTVKVMSSAE